LTYGTYCGGLLSEKDMGKTETGGGIFDTGSLRKYKNNSEAWGGWGGFQNYVKKLKKVADNHQGRIRNVAVRYSLDRRAVAGVIAGVRLGEAEHRADNVRVFDFTLGCGRHKCHS